MLNRIQVRFNAEDGEPDAEFTESLAIFDFLNKITPMLNLG